MAAKDVSTEQRSVGVARRFGAAVAGASNGNGRAEYCFFCMLRAVSASDRHEPEARGAPMAREVSTRRPERNKTLQKQRVMAWGPKKCKAASRRS